MALIWSWGWELTAPLTTLVNSGWSYSGLVSPGDPVTFHQHPSGIGGGAASCEVSSGAWIAAPNAWVDNATRQGTVNTTVRADSNWTKGAELLRVYSQLGDELVQVSMADNGSTSRLALLHAGVTFATSGARLQAANWHRLALQWNTQAGPLACALYVDGQLAVDGSTTLTTGATATGMRWGGAATSNCYHDHTVVYNDRNSWTRDATWIQGLAPNADDSLGPWVPHPGPRLYDDLISGLDGDYADTNSTGFFRVRMEDRGDVHVTDWTQPVVRGVHTLIDASGDGVLTGGELRIKLGAPMISGGTYTMHAGRSLARVLTTTKPGGGLWASTDLDNIEIEYEVA